MKVQPTNLEFASFLLWLDNWILTKGEAFKNYDSNFYEINQNYSGIRTFAAPFSQVVSDFSVPNNPQIPTGMYVNGVFCTKGISGLLDINYQNSQAYFTGMVGKSMTVSGRYAVKDINVTSITFPDISLVFEGKMNLRPKTSLNNANSGVKTNEITYPVVICRPTNLVSTPYEFGGTKMFTTTVECYIFADSQFLHDSISSIFSSAKHEYIGILNSGEFPFNSYGGMKNNTNYNYTGLANLSSRIGSGDALFINEVVITDFNRRGFLAESQNLSNDVYFGIAEFKVQKARLT